SETFLGEDGAYRWHENLWGAGPEVPLLADVRFRNSSGRPVLAPKAWGRRRVLFAWVEVAEDMSALPPRARAYVDQARNYLTAEPEPGSRACHVDRAGKRSRDGRPS